VINVAEELNLLKQAKTQFDWQYKTFCVVDDSMIVSINCGLMWPICVIG